MEQITLFISELFFTLHPFLRSVLVFLFAYGEGLPIIGTLLPGGTIALLVGSLSNDGFISPWTAISLIAIGSFLGDITGFFIGKKIQDWKWVARFVKNENHQKSWDLFDRNFAFIIVFGKLLPVVRSTPSFFAGARNINIPKYLFFSFLGSVLWSVAGIFGGNFLSKTVGNIAIPIILGILVVSALITLYRYLKKKKKKVK